MKPNETRYEVGINYRRQALFLAIPLAAVTLLLLALGDYIGAGFLLAVSALTCAAVLIGIKATNYIIISDKKLHIRAYRTSAIIPWGQFEKVEAGPEQREIRVYYRLPLQEGRQTSYSIYHQFFSENQEAVIELIRRGADEYRHRAHLTATSA